MSDSHDFETIKVEVDGALAEVERLAQQLIAMPSVPVAVTKEHVNSVARAMSSGTTSFADGDVLLGSVGEEESRAAAAAYREKAFGKKPS